MNAHTLHNLDVEVGQILDAEFPARRPMPGAGKTAGKPDADPVMTRVVMHRRDISSHEKAINRLQREQSIREAELQSELAALAQEIAEREAALNREAAEREAAITQAIELNRSRRAEEIKRRSKLAAMSYAAIAEAEREFSPVLDMRHLGSGRSDGGADIVHRHANINAGDSQ